MSVVKNIRAIAAALALGLLPVATAFAAVSVDHHPMRFEQLTLDDGLSQSNVLSIMQDSSGRMWFGTENGLNSYDGYEFQQYRRARGDTAALRNDFVFDVAEGADKTLWVATNGGGLAMRDPKSGDFTTYLHDPEDSTSIGGNIVRRLFIDADSNVWAGTRGAGVSRFDRDSGTFTQYRFSASEADSVFALLPGSDNKLWVGGDHGLSQLDMKTGEITPVDGEINGTAVSIEHSVRAILKDRNGHLWVGSYGGGLYRFIPGSKTVEHFVHDDQNPASVSGDKVTSIFEDSANRLWVGTTNGLNLIDRANGTFVRYTRDDTDPNSLGDNMVTVIFEDRGGVLWIGTKTHGLSKWNSRTWAYGFEPAKTLAQDVDAAPNVTSFVVDQAGLLWVGTFGNGVSAINRDTGEVTQYRHDPADSASIDDNNVMSLMRDVDGNIWVGTMSRGINRLNPKTGKIDRFSNNPDDAKSLSANGIMTMYEDSKGAVWVGTFGGGISRFDPEKQEFTRFKNDANDSHSLSSNRITAFVEDPDGNLWVGTDAGGLNLFVEASNSFVRFGHDADDISTLADSSVYSLNVDANGTVWVGTRGGGLDRIIGDASNPSKIQFANVASTDGLANDVIYGLQFDDNGLIWMSTNYGISQYDPQTGTIKNLHRKDGLQSEEFNFGAHYRSEGGELFFGGANGFNAFEPNNLLAEAAIPLITLTGFFNMNDPIKSDLPIDEDSGIELGYRDDVVSFEFAALDFAAPEMNQYAYKLEGFDREWINLGNERRITYTDLDAGNYLLRVRAANSEGVWNEAGYAIPVKVAAPPWATWWAYLAYVALVVQAIMFFWYAHKRKVGREEQYSRKLESEVCTRTEQLLHRNDQLKVLNEALQESSLSDPLTGLRNRRFVFEEITRDIELVKRRADDEQRGIDQSDAIDLVFMMIDLDNFKPINDTYGHAAGDQMLLEVRDVLLKTCRRSDFVIRWGGDEFLVIAKQTKPEESEALAERIRSTVAATSFSLGDGQLIRTTCSIGFAAYPLFKAQLDETGLDQIICLADGLMYEAKKHRNAWAGMFGPSEASTSFTVEDGVLEPTSLLFRAKRAGNLLTYNNHTSDQIPLEVNARQNQL